MLKKSLVLADLFQQMIILPYFGKIDCIGQAGPLTEQGPLAIEYIFQGILGRNEFDDAGGDIAMLKFLGRSNAMIAVQDIEFILDLIEFDRGQGFTFT